MKKKKINYFVMGGCFLMAFVLWTALLRLVDVQKIGPEDSAVGFATVNGFIHELIGVNLTLYTVTDWLGLVPFSVALGFAMLGLVQWIRRKHIFSVDRSILVLGVFYLVVMAVYLFFEAVSVNCRPVLVDGVLEASYPSSTTMLVMCVMPTAVMQLRPRIKFLGMRIAVVGVIAVFTIFMVVGRLISGVHWFSDIIGGGLLSVGLVTLYHAFVLLLDEKTMKK